MPSFARELEQTLHNALGEASRRRHEYATLEHLLIALIDDEHASKVMTACGVSRDELRASVKQYLDNELGALVADSATDPTPTSGFQRVVQRAILHVQSSGRDEVTGANVLVALFSERESYAVYFLQQQDMSRLDAVTYISHGVGKGESAAEPRAPEGGEEKTEKEGGKKESALKQFTVDLNEKARAGKVDPLIGRMPEVDRTVQIPAAGRRTTRFTWAIPASVRPPSPKASRARSSRATCQTCLRARPFTRSTWALCSPAPATAATSKSA
jgi:ATP-dependent Clp protease ATP-binding subunit ClpA